VSNDLDIPPEPGQIDEKDYPRYVRKDNRETFKTFVWMKCPVKEDRPRRIPV
jgi:hypothetical protein